MDETEKNSLHQFIQLALREDVGDGDHTSLSTIPNNAKGKAYILIKEKGILAGLSIAKNVFAEVDPDLQLEFLANDGQAVEPGDVVLVVSGRVHSILLAERLVLNIMQRMSG